MDHESYGSIIPGSGRKEETVENISIQQRHPNQHRRKHTEYGIPNTRMPPLRCSTIPGVAGGTVLLSLTAGFGTTNRLWHCATEGSRLTPFKFHVFFRRGVVGLGRSGAVDTTELCVFVVDVSCDLLPLLEGGMGVGYWYLLPTTPEREA